MGFYFLPNSVRIKLNWSLRLVVRTSGFHPENRGSIPLGTTNKKTGLMPVFLFVFSTGQSNQHPKCIKKIKLFKINF